MERRDNMARTLQQLRVLMLLEAASFGTAAAIHFGALLDGYGHRKAGTAETVLAVVPVAGSLAARGGRSRALRIALSAQAFAVFGVVVGLFTIAIGVGPRTALDLAYHGIILVLLVTGLAAALPPKATQSRRTA
jgi:hypothetical protein